MLCDSSLEIMTVTLTRVIHIISGNLVWIVVVVFHKKFQLYIYIYIYIERERERE